MSTDHNALAHSFTKLRADALERGNVDLALIYGWSLIRINFEMIEAAIARLSINDDIATR